MRSCALDKWNSKNIYNLLPILINQIIIMDSKIFTIKDSFCKVKVNTYNHRKTIKRKYDEIDDILNMNIYILNNSKIKYFNY